MCKWSSRGAKIASAFLLLVLSAPAQAQLPGSFPECAAPPKSGKSHLRLEGAGGEPLSVASCKNGKKGTGSGWACDPGGRAGGDSLAVTVVNKSKSAQSAVVMVLAIPPELTSDDLESVRVSGGDGGTVTIPIEAFGVAPGNPFVNKKSHGVYEPSGDAIYAFYYVGHVPAATKKPKASGRRTVEVVPVAGESPDVAIHFDVYDCETGDSAPFGHDLTWVEPGCRITIACPPAAASECSASAGIHTLGAPSWTSTCEGAVEVSSDEADTYGYRCPSSSEHAVTWWAANETHEATCTSTLTVVDTVAPALSCVGGQVLEADGQCRIIPALTTATDACEGALTVDCSADEFMGVGSHDLTCLATDCAGNVGSCTTTVTAIDVTAPGLTCSPSELRECSGPCGTAATPGATATDNCSEVAIDCPGAVGPFCLGSTTVTCTGTDASGNRSECSTVVEVVDTQAPSLTCSEDVVVRTSETGGTACAGTLQPAVVAHDVCDPDPAVGCDPATLALDQPGAVTSTCTVSDGSGNATECAQTLTLVDDTPPAVTCTEPQTLECTGPCATAATVAATGTDNCSDVATDCPGGAGPFCLGTTTITCGGEDASGNAVSCASSIEVVDTTAPQASCGPDLTVRTSETAGATCAASLAPTVSGQDLCDPSPAAGCDAASLALDQPGSVASTCTVSDGSGNTTECAQTLTLVDDTPPAVTCPAPQVVECAGPCATPVTVPAPSATDTCGVAAAGCAPGSELHCLGVTPHACFARDGSGNQADCATRITVIDTTAPGVGCGTSLTVFTSSLGGACAAALTPSATAADVCDPSPATNCAPADLSLSAPGTVTATCQGTDASDNAASCTQSLTLVDDAAPSVQCAAPAEVLLGAGGKAAAPSLSLGADDACPGAVDLVQEPAAGTPLAMGEHTVTVTATDAAGNAATCQTTLTVRGVFVDAAPYGEVLVYEDAGVEDGLTCLSGPADKALPGGTAPVTVVACFDETFDEPGVLRFHASAPIAPAGEVAVTAEPGAPLCFDGDTGLTFPGSSDAIGVTVCLDATADAIVSTTFAVTTSLSPVGEVALSGPYDPEADTLCLSGTTPTPAGLTGPTTARVCLGQGATVAQPPTFTSALASPLGTYELTGAYDPASGGLCFSGNRSVTFRAQPVTTTAQTCASYANPAAPAAAGATYTFGAALPTLGEAAFEGTLTSEQPCFQGSLPGDVGAWIDLPGLSVLSVTTTVCPAGSELGALKLDATLRLGQGDTALQLTASGSYDQNGDLALNLALDAPWTPFANLAGIPVDLSGLKLGTGAGTLLVPPAVAPTLVVEAHVPGPDEEISLIDQATAFALRSVGVRAHYDYDSGTPHLKVRLFGEVTLPAEIDSLVFEAEGEVTSAGIHFEGGVRSASGASSIEPLGFLPPGWLTLSLQDEATGEAVAGELTLDFDVGSAELSLDTSASVQILHLTRQIGMNLTVRHDPTDPLGLLIVVAGYEQGFDLDLGSYTLEMGKLGSMVVAASSRYVDDYAIDADGDPANGKEAEIELELGLNVVGYAALPFIDPFIPGAEAFIRGTISGADKFSVKGAVELPLHLVRPDDGLPSINRVWMERVGFEGTVSGPGAEIRLFGDSKFEPIARNGQVQPPITATAAFVVDSSGAIGGELFLDGLWKEPLFIPRFAFSNPGLSFKVAFDAAGVPYPSSLGFNGQAFILKEGEWPNIVFDNTGNPILPENVWSAGGTFFYDRLPTKSGICVLLKCATIPTILYRVDRQNMALSDLVTIAELVRQATVSLANVPGLEALADIVPNQALQPIDISPLDATLKRNVFYASTHNTRRFGMAFSAGLRGELTLAATDLEGTTHEVELKGSLTPSKYEVSGRMTPLRFIPGLEIAGDPYRREATLSGGTVTVPPTAAFDGARTLEAWVLTSSPGTILSRTGGHGGFELLVGELAPAECDEAPCGDAFRVRARLFQGGHVREISSEHGVIAPQTRQHVALTLLADGTATLYVDGEVVSLTGAPTGLLPGGTGAPLVVGAGLTAVDDVRIWTAPRPAEAILAESRIMPHAFRQDPDLAARYEFDFDEGTVAHNSRLGGAPNGAYTGGAHSGLVTDDQDLYIRLVDQLAFGPLQTPVGLIGDGFWFRGGLRLDLDPPLPGATIGVAAETALSLGTAKGKLYARNLPMLHVPGLGGFQLSGDGPNAVPGDFDDGLYLAGDLIKSPLPTLNASARLRFLDASGQTHELGSATLLLDCLKPAGCPERSDYTLRTSGAIDLALDLGPGLGALEIRGQQSFDSDTGEFTVDGTLSAFGQTLASTDISVTAERASLSASLGATNIGGVPVQTSSNLAVEMTFDPPKLCASGDSNIAITGFGSFTGAFATCLGNQSSGTFTGVGSASLLGIPLAAVDVTLSSASGLTIEEATVQIPGMFHGEVSGFYRSPSDFQLTGTSTVGSGPLQLRTILTMTPAGAVVQVAVNPSCPTCAVRSNLNGTLAVSGGAIAWDLSGSAQLSLAGFTLASGTLRLSSDGGAEVAGVVDLGLSTVTMSGSFSADGAFSLSGTFHQALFGGQVVASGTATLDNSGARLGGALAVWGSSAAFQASVGAFGGAAGAFDLAAQMGLQAPTSAGTYDLGNAMVILGYQPGAPLSVTVSGSFGVSGLSAQVSGALSAHGFDLTGTMVLGPLWAPVGSGSVTMTPAGASLDVTSQVPGFPAARFHGAVSPAIAGALEVDGAVDVGGLQLSSSRIRMDGTHAVFDTTLSLGSFLGHTLGSATVSLDLSYSPLQACGTGTVAMPTNASVTCTAGVCLGFSGGLATVNLGSLSCGGFCLGNDWCAPGEFCDAIGKCHGKKPNGNGCAGSHECQSGFCDIWAGSVCATPLPDGVGCTADGQCLSGNCGHRPGSLSRHCYTPGSRHIGEECFDTNHCAVGTCWGNVWSPSRCLCTENQECAASPNVPTGHVCSLGSWGFGSAGFCVAP